MKLFICEKPSQARDIAPHIGARQRGEGCFTGPGVTVTWCVGHLLEQAKPEHYVPELRYWDINLLPVIPERWQLDVKGSCKSQYRVVADLMKSASEVVIATDADREGEVIAREVMDRARYKGPVRRLWLGALDDASIKAALGKLQPGDKTLPLYHSGLGRARADWLAGMNVTMALTSAFGKGGGSAGVMHCGRVQTPVLALIVRRERLIANFVPKTHYVLDASFEMLGSVVSMDWVAPNDLLDADGHCLKKGAVEQVATKIKGKTGRLSKVQVTPESELAPLPYCLETLQRDGSARYGFKAQTVLDACQALYEKHKAATYPRTDCEYLPQSMFGEVGRVMDCLKSSDPSIGKIVASASIDNAGRAFNDKKITAHHAIIPTLNPDVKIANMTQEERLVYDLIRRRYLAQFLGDYEFEQTRIEVECQGELFTKMGKTPTRPGWKRAYDGILESPKAKERAAAAEVTIPAVKVGDQALNVKASVEKTATKPPKRYTDGTLIAAMGSIDKVIDDPRLRRIMQTKEKAGIGTDATRAATIEGLFKRQYIENQKRFIVPTERGMNLIEMIEGIAPELADPVLTAEWEDKMMQIAAGTLPLPVFEQDISTWLNALIEKIRTQAPARPARASRGPGEGQGAPVEAGKCPSCGAPMRRREIASGVFWGCSTFPKCKTSLPDADGVPGQRTERPPAPRPSPVSRAAATAPAGAAVNCSLCAKPMVLRSGQRGPFYGCSGYPVCRAILNIEGSKLEPQG